MELIRGLHNLRDQHRHCVASIGNFDGVHLGHREVIKLLTKRAAEAALPSTLILFEPQPLEFLAPERAPYRITRFREKLRLLNQHGIVRVLSLRFDQRLKQMSAQTFIQTVLVDGLGVQHLVVGDDFHFGRDREGNFEMLKSQGEQRGFVVESTPTCWHAGQRVSSTAIRKALSEHDLATAQHLLGRVVDIAGKVVHGQKLGRTIGVPTANIRLHKHTPAIQGVFATRIHGLGSRVYEGVANIGHRPTVGGLKPQLEVHIFDWQQNLYGRHLRVEFCEFIRREMKFSGLEPLQTQIQRDIITAKAYFAGAK